MNYNSKTMENSSNELTPEIIEALEWKSDFEFFVSPDAAEFQITAYKAVMAWIRSDIEEMIQYYVNPNYEVLFREEQDDWTHKIEYMIFKIPTPPTYVEKNNIIYRPASYQFLLKGDDSIYYIDMELIKTENGWKVNEFIFQK